MKLQINKVMLLVKGLNILQLLVIVVLVIGRVFMDTDFIGVSILVNRDVVLVFLVFIVIINFAIGQRDMGLLKTLIEKLSSQEQDIDNINDLNNTLRAQRHDFLNHVQIIYALLEMEEHDEAKVYMDKLYKEIKQTGKYLKTSQAAINALIRAKMIEAEEKECVFVFDTNTRLEHMDIEVWQLCRVMSNLIDNAIYATLEYPSRSYIRVRIDEKEESLQLIVENAGYPIEDKLRVKMFAPGITTKQEELRDHGLGLHIVKEIIDKYKGTITVSCENYMTKFLVEFPRL